MTVETASELLTRLVRIPSVSGDEAVIAAELCTWADDCGLDVWHDDTAVRITVDTGVAGPTLLFASHLDTVPPGSGWSVDPFAGVIEQGRLVARGAVDAKASIAAMAVALREHGDGRDDLRRGRLVLLATYGEETKLTTMPKALARLGDPPDAAIIGEPTGLRPAIAQRGLLLLKLIWAGEQVHAGWAAEEEPRPANAILAAADDLVRLNASPFDREHPVLGEVVVTPTQIEAGVARNVTPPSCEVVLDIRSTPSYTHAEIAEQIDAILDAEVEVISDRLEPAATPEDSVLLAAIRRAHPETMAFASPTCSDWTFLRDVDAVKLGPGESRQSHTIDETIELSEVDAAAELLFLIAQEYLS